MESLLLGGDDDSSSGESDTEVAVSGGGAGSGSAVAAAAAAQVTAPSPAPSAPAQQQSQSRSQPMSKTELARLRNLYSPAAAAKQTNSGSTAPPLQQTRGPPPPAQQQHPPPSMQSRPPQQQQHHQQPSHRSGPMGSSHQSGGGSASMPSQQQQHQRSNSAPHRTSSGGRGPTAHHIHHASSIGSNRSASSSTSSQQQQKQRGMPPSSRNSGPSHDPFEPTPVSEIIQRQQHKQAAASRKQQQQHRTIGVPPGSSGSSSGQPPSARPPYAPGSTGSTSSKGSMSTAARAAASSISTMDRASQEREMKKHKERFLVFTRVLLKYLEQKDPPLHQKVKAIIKDCAERNKRQERGYESVTASMRARLREVVNETYWKKAEAYLEHFLKNKRASGSGGTTAVSGSSGNSSIGRPVPTSGGSRTAADIERLRKLDQAKKLEAARVAAAAKSGSSSSLQSMQNEIAAKRRKLQNEGTPSSSPATTTTAQTGSSSTKQTGKGGKGGSGGKRGSSKTTTGQRKSASGASTPTATAAAATVTAAATPQDTMAEPPVREYSKLMEMVDHAVNFDWTTAGLALGPSSELMVSEEQHNLLYPAGPFKKLGTPAPIVDAFPLRGWGQRNVVSSRTAWARVRLRELHVAVKEQQNAKQENAQDIPRISSSLQWMNEDRAENDKVLAVLSEGTQIYLRSVLEKAVHCARERQNLDGIRLWHQQSMPNLKPALSLRLGCDVGRQVAQAAGNASMTVKRIEEALARQTGVREQERNVASEEVLMQASSMSDLAMRPLLAKGAEDADYHAKRAFEVYGGKDSDEPPLGRLSKKAKLEVQDFEMGQHFTSKSGSRHRAGTAAFMF